MSSQPDPSWYLHSYSEEIRHAYMPLTEAPLKLQELPPVRPYPAVENRIYRLLHQLLRDHEEFFVDIVPRIIPQKTNTRGGPRRPSADPKVCCLARLESELAKIEKDKLEAAWALPSSLAEPSLHEPATKPANPAAPNAHNGRRTGQSNHLLEHQGESVGVCDAATSWSPPKKRRISACTAAPDIPALFHAGAPAAAAIDRRAGHVTNITNINIFSDAFIRAHPPRPVARTESSFTRTDTTTSTTTNTSTDTDETWSPPSSYGDLPDIASFLPELLSQAKDEAKVEEPGVDEDVEMDYEEEKSKKPVSIPIDTEIRASIPTAPTLRSRPPVPSASRRLQVTCSTAYCRIVYGPTVHFAVTWEFERLLIKAGLSWDDHVSMDHVFALVGTAQDVMPRIHSIVDWIKTGTPPASLLPEGRRCDVDSSAAVSNTLPPRRARMYIEMDQEERSIRANDGSGLGVTQGLDWKYGGNIAYSILVRPAAKVTKVNMARAAEKSQKIPVGPSTTPSKPINPKDNTLGPDTSAAPPRSTGLEFIPLPPEMPGKSFRLARRYGSRRIVALKLSKELTRPESKRAVARELCGSVLIIFGRTYRAFFAPPDGDAVFCIETNEHDKRAKRNDWEPAMPTFEDLVATFNDLEQKPKQAMAKWAARPAILFSDTVPAAIVPTNRVICIRDIVSSQAKTYESATTEETLTDGCGLMSESLAARLKVRDDGPRPFAVQIRYNGAKGMIALMSPEQHRQYAGVDLVLRDSMIKAKPADRCKEDQSLNVVEVVRDTFLRIGTFLSSEAIVIMVHNGVPEKVILDMSTQCLDDLRDAFSPHPLAGTSETSDDVLNRIVASCWANGVSAEKAKRALQDAGRSLRAAGMSKGHGQDDDLDPSAEASSSADSVMDCIDPRDRYGVNPLSGLPGSIAECLMLCAASGLDPATSSFAATKLHYLVNTLSESLVRNFKIEVESSISAFIVPDPLGILKPNEIACFFSSKAPTDPVTGCTMSHLSGPVLAFRSPCKVPTDVRKFEAVFPYELSYLKDCIIMSAHSELCSRSPASYLGGGDYDGDTLQVFWDQKLVEPFTNADDKYAEVPDDFVSQNFDKEVIKVDEFLQNMDTAGADREIFIEEQQKFLLAALGDDRLTGQYSDMHGNAVYRLGLDHPETVRLAQMFCHVLDARKSGLVVKGAVKSADSRKYGGDLDWRDFKKKEGRDKGYNTNPVKRSKSFGPFILDMLMQAGQSKQKAIMAHFPKQLDLLDDYHALAQPWRNVKDTCDKHCLAELREEIAQLERHVKTCLDIHTRIGQGIIFEKPISAVYDEVFLGNPASGSGSPTKRKPASLLQHSTPSKKDKADRDIDKLRELGQIRALSEAWIDKVDIGSFPRLCPSQSDHEFRKLLISCGAVAVGTYQRYKRAQQTFTFDMDFRATCAIRAESRGKNTSTVLEATMNGLKPNVKRKWEP